VKSEPETIEKPSDDEDDKSDKGQEESKEQAKPST
jgi:hypothetical protein